MASQHTINVNGVEGNLYRDGNEDCPAIYIFRDGKFGAKVGEAWVLRASLKSLENYLKKGRPSVRLFRALDHPSFHTCSLFIMDVAEMTDNRVIDKDGKRHYCGYGNWYVYDQKVVQALQAYEAKRAKLEKELNEEFMAIMKKAKRVYKSEIKNLLKGKPLGSDDED